MRTVISCPVRIRIARILIFPKKNEYEITDLKIYSLDFIFIPA